MMTSWKVLSLTDPTPTSVALTVPTPMTIDISVNLTCTATGGIPVPQIWWDCCEFNDTSYIEVTEGLVMSTLTITPGLHCNKYNCTCFVHQVETSFPVIKSTEELVVYCMYMRPNVLLQYYCIFFYSNI